MLSSNPQVVRVLQCAPAFGKRPKAFDKRYAISGRTALLPVPRET
jgi:hypothetical protein